MSIYSSVFYAGKFGISPMQDDEMMQATRKTLHGVLRDL